MFSNPPGSCISLKLHWKVNLTVVAEVNYYNAVSSS